MFVNLLILMAVHKYSNRYKQMQPQPMWRLIISLHGLLWRCSDCDLVGQAYLLLLSSTTAFVQQQQTIIFLCAKQIQLSFLYTVVYTNHCSFTSQLTQHNARRNWDENVSHRHGLLVHNHFLSYYSPKLKFFALHKIRKIKKIT